MRHQYLVLPLLMIAAGCVTPPPGAAPRPLQVNALSVEPKPALSEEPVDDSGSLERAEAVYQTYLALPVYPESLREDATSQIHRNTRRKEAALEDLVSTYRALVEHDGARWLALAHLRHAQALLAWGCEQLAFPHDAAALMGYTDAQLVAVIAVNDHLALSLISRSLEGFEVASRQSGDPWPAEAAEAIDAVGALGFDDAVEPAAVCDALTDLWKQEITPPNPRADLFAIGERDCREGDARSCRALGDHYRALPDIERALTYYNRACDAGLLKGCRLAGLSLLASEPPRLTEADQVLERACVSGDGPSCLAARVHTRGVEHASHAEACAAGDPMACLKAARVAADTRDDRMTAPCTARDRGHRLMPKARAHRRCLKGDPQACLMAAVRLLPTKPLALPGTRPPKVHKALTPALPTPSEAGQSVKDILDTMTPEVEPTDPARLRARCASGARRACVELARAYSEGDGVTASAYCATSLLWEACLPEQTNTCTRIDTIFSSK